MAIYGVVKLIIFGRLLIRTDLRRYKMSKLVFLIFLHLFFLFFFLDKSFNGAGVVVLRCYYVELFRLSLYFFSLHADDVHYSKLLNVSQIVVIERDSSPTNGFG